MIKCCVVLEEYVGIYLFKDQYVVATESFDYGPDVLNSIFDYLKQYNVSVLNVVMSSYLTCEVYREVVVANEYDIEGKNFYEYVPEIDVDKIRHLATVAKVPEINFYGSISCDIKLADKAIIVDQVDNMFSVLVVIDGELKATAYCRESNLKSILLNMSMKYQTVNFIDVKNFIDPDKLEFFTNYTMVTELSLLPTLTLCSCILDGCVSSFDSTNISSRGSESGVKGRDIYQYYLDMFEKCNVPFTYQNTTNPILLTRFIDKLNLSDRDKDELKRRIKVIFPAENPGMTFDTKNVFTLKKDALRKFLTQYNDVETLRCLEYSKYTLDEEDKDIIKKKARDLDTGAYAVDRNLSVNNDIESEMLYLKGF